MVMTHHGDMSSVASYGGAADVASLGPAAWASAPRIPYCIASLEVMTPVSLMSVCRVVHREHFTCQTFRHSEFQSVVNRTDVSPSGIAALVASLTISYVSMSTTWETL